MIVAHQFAWDTLSLALFGMGGVANEIILETANDLRCSAFLSSELFIKQSLQMLRNFCEACVGTLYFQRSEQEFAAWIDDSVNYHYPDYRTMVNSPQISQILSPKERNFLHRKYTQLNNSVHNKRNRLNMNLKRIEQQTNAYGISEIAEWARETKRIVGFMLELFVRLWQANYWRRPKPR